MKRAIKYLIIIILLGAALVYWNYRKAIDSPLSASGADTLFTVAQGESVEVISRNLKAAGLINSDFYFQIYTRRQGRDSQIQAGEYMLNRTLSIKEIVNALVTGASLSRENTIKIIEGWSINNIDDYSGESKIITPGAFKDLALADIGRWKFSIPKPVFLEDAPPEASLEGYLFPDTYRIFKEATAEDIVAKMLDNFSAKLTPEWRTEINRQNKSVYEIITMASLVEKEVRTYADMEVVSGIFWDRIKNGQALESCATLAYILGENKAQYTQADTEIDSLYNTYRHQGLPPGPIANPGLNAIKAAIYPRHTDYNYFLTRSDNGETVFSETYEEHLENKARYIN